MTQPEPSTETTPSAQAPPAGIRVVVFSDAFRHRNGVGAYYCDLIQHLAGRVGHAELVCPGLTPAGKAQGLSLPLPGDKTQKLCLPGIPKAIRVMRRVRPHVVVLASPGPYGMLGLLLGRLFRAHICVGYHTEYSELVDMYWNRVFGGFSARCLRVLDRVFFRVGTATVTNSRPMVDAARRLGARDVRLVGTPIEPGLLRDPAPLDRTEFGPVLFVGRLAPEKNLEAVIDAAAKLPNVPFVIAGDGPQRKLVEDAAREHANIDYLGWVNREELVATLDRCEMLVLPSRIESFGTVAAEAMARERMVLVSEHCGIRDWEDLAEGLLVFTDEESLADAVKRVSHMSVEERAAQARRARQQAVAFINTTLDQWVDLLDTASSQKRGQKAQADAVKGRAG